MNKIRVFKVGGSILGDNQRRDLTLKRIISIVKDDYAIIVVSAMGRYPYAFSTDGLLALGEGLLSKKETDRLLSIGEILSSLVVTKEFRKLGKKAASISMNELGFITDCSYGQGYVKSIDNEKYIDYFKNNQFLIAPGFIALSEENEPITLGREASDLSGVLLALNNEADNIIFFKEDGRILFPLGEKLLELYHNKYNLFDLDLLAKYGYSPIHHSAIKDCIENNLLIKIIGVNKYETSVKKNYNNCVLLGVVKLNNKFLLLSAVPCRLFELLDNYDYFKALNKRIVEDGIEIKISKTQQKFLEENITLLYKDNS